jgi:tetratricopeptide (TPR) repeat protein
MSRDIEQLIRAEDWGGARTLIEEELAAEPQNHWLLTRLALTYYEQYDYQRALQISEQAYAQAPHCPLVLWDYAGALDMLQRHEDAIRIYRQLIRRGVESIAYDKRGEGIGRARGLIADCYYRLSACYRASGRERAALRAFIKHLDMRGPGCFSIYRLKDIGGEFKLARGTRPNSAVHRRQASPELVDTLGSQAVCAAA